MDPALPLARLRVRGQLTEIRADDLRFQEVEASQYLSQMLSPPLSEEEVSLLVSRTEGWIAGLQLAALALQKREDRAAFLRAFTGSQRYLLDYVQEDILARLPRPCATFCSTPPSSRACSFGVPGGDRSTDESGQPADARVPGASQPLPGPSG